MNSQTLQFSALQINGKICFAKAGQGSNLFLYRSTDFGATFISTGIGTIQSKYLGLTATETGILYIMQSSDKMLIRSTDAGSTWLSVRTIPGDCIYASDTGQIIVSNQDTLLISCDGGVTFNTELLGDEYFYGLRSVVKKTNGKYYTSVARLGLYSFNLLNELNTNPPIPKEYFLEQNFPNPFNPSTSIRYQIPNAGNVKLVVYDVLGKEVATLVNKEQTPGSYTVTFDGSKLASGVYIYKLTAGNYTATKKLNLLK